MLHTTSSKEEVVRLSKTWKLAGLILVWVPKNIGEIIFNNVESPVVFIDSHFNDEEKKYHNIGLQDEQGGYLITRYLISMGHTNVVFLANDILFTGTDLNRFKGCQKAFEQEGLTFDENKHIPLPKERSERYKIYTQFTKKDNKYTALIFSSDYYATEAMSFLQDCGINIPQDISVTGFDDNIFARIIRPHLTTIHQNPSEKGKVAVSMLMKLIQKKTIEEPNVKLKVELKIRDSVKNINK